MPIRLQFIIIKIKSVKESNSKKNDQSVKKIIALGNITITSEDKIAVTDKAIFTVKDGILILSGKNTSISTKGGKIQGEKIIYNTNDGQIAVESSKNKKVEAVLNPEKQGDLKF